MNCAEVTAHLADHVAGAPPSGTANRIERHLARCIECRAEHAALQQGMASLGEALPPVDPPPNLGERIVARISAARTERSATARRVKALAASTLAAALVAAGALSWAVAERGHVNVVREQARAQVQSVKRIITALEAVGARPYRADLLPARQYRKSFGSVAIYSAMRVNDFILVAVVIPDDHAAPYTAKATDPSGRVLSRGPLTKTNNGDWVFYESTRENLSKAISVSVLDRSGRAVVVGSIRPATGEQEDA